MQYFVPVACLAAGLTGVLGDTHVMYMNSVLRQAGTYLNELSLNPASVPAVHNVSSGSHHVEISNVQVSGLDSLTAKKCKFEKGELECDIPLKPVKMVAFGRMKTGSGPFQDVSIELPVKEGELEVEVKAANKEVKVKFDDKLKFENLRFTPSVTSDTRGLEALSKQLEPKLATSVAEFISKEYFNVVKNAVMHVPLPGGIF